MNQKSESQTVEMAVPTSEMIRRDFLSRVGAVDEENKGHFCDQSMDRKDGVSLPVPVLVNFRMKSQHQTDKERNSDKKIRCVLLSVSEYGNYFSMFFFLMQLHVLTETSFVFLAKVT